MAAKQSKPSKQAVQLRPVGEPLKQPAKVYVSEPVPLPLIKKTSHRVDLVFHGLDHSGASYSAHVFLNNKKANAKTPHTAQNGYAGTFHVFGHGGCFGDVGHCEVRGVPRPYDPRPAHPLTPAKKTLIATDAMRRVAGKGKDVTVTVVPIVRAGTDKCDYDDVFKFEKISVVSYI
ncbi:MAG TPA: hypothetical protein VJA94_09440 [Candidatus Angelobacter sp.]